MSTHIAGKLYGKAKQSKELNDGRARAYPEWKYRLLSDNARVLRDLGFVPFDNTGILGPLVLKRIEKARVIYLSLPDGIMTRIQVNLRYLDSTLSWMFDMDERFADLVARGWNNEALFAFGVPEGVKAQ